MPCPRCCVASVLDALGHAGQAGKLPHDPASTDVARQARLTQLLRPDWVIHAKGVRLRVRADNHCGKCTVAINGPTFIARFLQHVLPPGFKRIRHYGLLSPGSMPRGWPPLVWHGSVQRGLSDATSSTRAIGQLQWGGK